MTAISWCSRLPRTVGTSTTEAAMMAAVETAKEAIRVYDILMAIGHDLDRPTIYCDNQAVNEWRTQYYAGKLIYLCELCSTMVTLKFTPVPDDILDIFTEHAKYPLPGL